METTASVARIIREREERTMNTKVERKREEAKKVGDWDETKRVKQEKRKEEEARGKGLKIRRERDSNKTLKGVEPRERGQKRGRRGWKVIAKGI